MADKAECFEEYWSVLRRGPENLTTTMNTAEAIERISQTLAVFARMLGHPFPLTVGFQPVYDEGGHIVSWKSFLDGLPPKKELGGLELLGSDLVDAFKTIEDGLESLYASILKALKEYQENVEHSIQDILEDLRAHKEELHNLRKLQQSMGLYDRRQLTIPQKELHGEVDSQLPHQA